ncbi:HNH endonuclease [Candidatus Pacearchaeota archaeon]|nr:HNH endonuclease [Candidatus Pacearchaeota archaeon]
MDDNKECCKQCGKEILNKYKCGKKKKKESLFCCHSCVSKWNAKNNHNFGMKGKHHSKETRQQISFINKTENLSEETKKRRSECHKIENLSLETRKRMSEAQTGKHLSEEAKRKMRESTIREKNSRWKGEVLDSGNYISIYNEGDKRRLMHRLVWGEAYGEIPKGCVIHHKDGNSKNNDLTNLQMMTVGEHFSYHNKKETRKKKDREETN